MAKSNRKPSPDEGQPQQKPSGREDARAKLQRMEDTNKLCYKHRNDMDRLVAELKKFHYGDAELDYILEPKGNKNIPGYSFYELERQRKYVKYLDSRTPKAQTGHAEAEDARRDESEREPQV